ncbi:MAG: cobalt ECF transporter T component CbiQ [Lachnospiraceae bacterium]|nr:cobalt ECF transporter T component CbiQ [Lachnospiraceae bacterium]
MSKIGQAISEIQTLESVSKEDTWLNRIHPLSKLILTVFYIAVTVSFHKYDLFGLFAMILYPAVVFMVGELSFKDALRRLRIVLPLVLIMGVLNPFFDRTPLLKLGNIAVSGGVVSMVTLMIKAVLTVLAGYLLIATTSIEKICYALRLIHVPKIFVTVVLLIYRYISVLLSEAHRITEAYSLRAPRQKGVHYKVWGSLLGQMLIRSMDRAGVIYESMQLRGFSGDFGPGKKEKAKTSDFLWPVIWCGIIILFRLFPVIRLLGSLFV